MDKAVVIGDSDPRRPIYFPELKPGVELSVPSFGETEMPVITRVSAWWSKFQYSSHSAEWKLRSHTPRPVLHRTFLPPAPSISWPSYCCRPGPGIQVGNTRHLEYIQPCEPLLMFGLRVGIDQVHKLFSHFTENQVVGDLGRWRFWWWWFWWRWFW